MKLLRLLLAESPLEKVLESSLKERVAKLSLREVLDLADYCANGDNFSDLRPAKATIENISTQDHNGKEVETVEISYTSGRKDKTLYVSIDDKDGKLEAVEVTVENDPYRWGNRG